MKKFKVGDKVKVIKAYSKDTEKGVGLIGKITKIRDAKSLGDAEDGYYLDVQNEYAEIYYYEDQLMLVDEIDEKEYKQAISNLMKENNDLKEQLDYADKQLERQADIIDKLEEHAQELHDKLIEKMKGE